MSAMKILIYGAIARQQTRHHSLNRCKTSIKIARDRLLWGVGSTATLDYRNYNAPHPTNVGDVAIAEAVRNQLRSQFPNASFYNVNWGELVKCNGTELADYDLIVIAGSGFFHVSKDGALDTRLEDDMVFLKSVDVPVVLYGVGVNRGYLPSRKDRLTISPRAQVQLKQFLKRCSLVNVRNLESKLLLEKFTDLNIDVTCDPAVFLDPVTLIEQNHENCVKREQLKVGVNFSFHGPLSTEILKRNLPEYVNILKRLRADTGCSFFYFVHNHTEYIIPQLLKDKGIDVETVAGNPYELSARYREMNVHIGGMLHSCILSVGAGTPCVLLAYDVKHFGFAELFDLAPFCHDVSHLDPHAVLESVRQLLSKELDWRQRIAVRLSELGRDQEQFLKSCASAIRDDAATTAVGKDCL